MKQYHYTCTILTSKGSSNQLFRSRQTRSSLVEPGVEQSREPSNRFTSLPHILKHWGVGSPHRQPPVVRLVDTLAGTRPRQLYITACGSPRSRLLEAMVQKQRSSGYI